MKAEKVLVLPEKYMVNSHFHMVNIVNISIFRKRSYMVIWSYGQHPHFYGQKLPKLFSIFCWLMSHYRPITHFCWVTHHFWCWKKSHDSTIQRWEITMGNHHGNPATSHFFPWCWWCWRWKSHKHHEIPLESYYNPLNPIKWWKSPL